MVLLCGRTLGILDPERRTARDEQADDQDKNPDPAEVGKLGPPAELPGSGGAQESQGFPTVVCQGVVAGFSGSDEARELAQVELQVAVALDSGRPLKIRES